MIQTEDRRQVLSYSSKRGGRTRRLFAIDAIVFGLFILVMNVPLTGLAVHEWLGIAIAILLVVHLVQHGDWIATTSRRMIDSTSFQNRINFLMMVALFLGFWSMAISGLLISEVALPWIGYTPGGGQFWLWLHLSSVVWVVGLAATHIALNWRWIASTSERLVFAPLRNYGGSR